MELLLQFALFFCVIISALSDDGSRVVAEPWSFSWKSSSVQPIRPGQPPQVLPDSAFSPIRPPPSSGWTWHGNIFPTSPKRESYFPSSVDKFPAKAFHPHRATRPSSIALAPSTTSSVAPTKKQLRGPVSSPPVLVHKQHAAKNKSRSSASAPSYLTPHIYRHRGSVSPSQPPFPMWGAPAPMSSPTESSQFNMPILPPTISPLASSSLKKMKAPPPLLIMSLPPPPPNEDCASVACTEPLTYTPPGSPCGCVWPIQVKIRLGVAIYAFFPLVSELANEIASSVELNHSQVRIMGANAAGQQLEGSTVLINLVPRGVKFDDATAFLIYKKFWHGDVFIRSSLFGAYEVVYVRYPGLPPSPPSVPSSISTTDEGPNHGQTIGGQAIKPLGVDVSRRKRDRLSGSMIAVIVLSSFTSFLLCLGIATLLYFKFRACSVQDDQIPQSLVSFPAKPSGAGRSLTHGSMSSSASMSCSSGTLAYTGTAKTFTINDIERATNNFDASRKIGEGGFGIVYRAILDDGREVAVKVLKREDHHGGREFLAEIEMLSRLHHRNLVKLIGICTEHTRCLVYELVPNGSVDSHLHGVDKKTGPLDWSARMKIALGAARGLAYLHEDSSPRVIHRDFKSSNILLENDFTPKVSDFGLARTALDEGNKHISTHVMGTFGYLAPEYAMTGHLLVKSDVYSYGVVLLELLTGRKPVDLSQPPGQENLVAWGRPLLTSKEGLELIIDPAIKSSISYDSIAKVAAIASMCVQPEVSHRPFMGEVVQALKLVCNEFDEMKELVSIDCSQEEVSINIDSDANKLSGELVEVSQTFLPIYAYRFSHDTGTALSASDFLSMSVEPEEHEAGTSRRHSRSGPLRPGRRRQFWQRLRSFSRGSKSEHGFSFNLWEGSH
ncbi:receptor-like serine/threonine-protein kinase ALE2 isoform X2 [Carica papaya]|uniref:receptor-like serine/threonine-protein kinase ALE2 isoform X2 n=1 Tax=Carica papaya TaxID=3649 RepID=UPI000B8C9FE6|nr:receptor-like serine/threonine-protein kinase ALE2 isoform X2 [Carica papaya]